MTTTSAQDEMWDRALRTPAQVRDENLKNRAKAAPPPARFVQPGATCGLCGKDGRALIRMQRFDKQGTVLSCGTCLSELIA